MTVSAAPPPKVAKTLGNSAIIRWIMGLILSFLAAMSHQEAVVGRADDAIQCLAPRFNHHDVSDIHDAGTVPVITKEDK